jgi:hypothetical protein
MNDRVFTDKQENQLIEELTTGFWNQDAKLSSQTCKHEASMCWTKYRKDTLNPYLFSSSNHFRANFFERHSLSLRTLTVKKVTPPHNGMLIEEYLKRLRAAEARYGPGLGIKMHETSWCDVQLAGKIVAQKGTLPGRCSWKRTQKAHCPLFAQCLCQETHFRYRRF